MTPGFLNNAVFETRAESDVAKTTIGDWLNHQPDMKIFSLPNNHKNVLAFLDGA